MDKNLAKQIMTSVNLLKDQQILTNFGENIPELEFNKKIIEVNCQQYDELKDIYENLNKKHNINEDFYKDLTDHIMIFFKSEKLFNFNDYIWLKKDSLELYKSYPVQDLWFSIQEEVNSLITMDNKFKHPFWKEIKNNKLMSIFLDWSDYCNKELASSMIWKLNKVNKNKLNKL